MPMHTVKNYYMERKMTALCSKPKSEWGNESCSVCRESQLMQAGKGNVVNCQLTDNDGDLLYYQDGTDKSPYISGNKLSDVWLNNNAMKKLFKGMYDIQ